MVFRQLAKPFGVDVMVTEFVSAEGIFRRNERTLEYLEFSEEERPLGVQLFGADPGHLAEAAQIVRDWKRPDFLDLNFGCPVNKVVSKNGGSALLRDCPLLEKVAVKFACDFMDKNAKCHVCNIAIVPIGTWSKGKRRFFCKVEKLLFGIISMKVNFITEVTQARRSGQQVANRDLAP